MPIATRVLGPADQRPCKAAVICGAQCWSYGDLGDRARGAAARVLTLAHVGGAPSEVIGVLLDNALSFLEVFLGVIMTGAAPAVLDPKWTDKELRGALSSVVPCAVICQPELMARVRDVAPETAVIAAPDPAEVAFASDPASSGAADDAPFLIGFTSGTTGAPKAYIRSHRSWLASLDAAAAEFPVAADEHVLIPGRLHHSMFLYAVIESLAAGATAYLLPQFDAGDVVAQLRHRPITRIHGVPTMYAAILETVKPGEVFPSVRTVISAGAKLPAESAQALRGLFPASELVEYYGASELSFVSIASARERHPRESVGRPFHGVEVQVRRGDGAIAGAGEVGCLWVRSEMVCSGYVHSPDATDVEELSRDGPNRLRMEDGWATVGDLAWRDVQGLIYLMGREAGLMIRGGLNVYAGEVEAVLLTFPEIAQAAVLGLPDRFWGERVCAVVRWRAGAALDLAELRTRCRGLLQPEKRPQQLFTIERFPYTASGKIATATLRDWLLAGRSDLREVA